MLIVLVVAVMVMVLAVVGSISCGGKLSRFRQS